MKRFLIFLWICFPVSLFAQTPPTALQVVPVSPTSIRLVWTDPNTDESYLIERRLGRIGTFVGLAATKQKTWTDSAWVTPETEYEYRIRALRGTAYSTVSVTVRVVTPVDGAAPPTDPSLASPDRTCSPPAARITDTTGAIWTIGVGGRILRDGMDAAGGLGSQLIISTGIIYALGTDNRWWVWGGNSWSSFGASAPAACLVDVTPPPIPPITPTDPPPIPTPAPNSRYISTTGNDSNTGTLTQPFRTVTKCATVSVGGSSCVLRGGTYVESLTLTDYGGTSWDQTVRFIAYPGETPILRPNSGQVITLNNVRYVEFIDLVIDGFNTDGTSVLFTNPANHHIRFRGCEIKNTGRKLGGLGSHGTPINTNGFTGGGADHEFINNSIHDNGNGGYDHGLYISGRGHLLDGNHIYHNAGHGIHKYPSGDAFVIRNNRINDNGQSGYLGAMHGGGSGIGLYGGSGTQVHNNLVYGNYEAGVRLRYGERTGFIYYNTFYSNRVEGVDDAYADAPSTIRNNIVYANGANISGYGSSTIDHNLMSDPQFMNSGSGDFRLNASSPAIGVGYPVTTVITDITGKARGAPPTIGAYEP